jgi:hypothetical protein
MTHFEYAMDVDDMNGLANKLYQLTYVADRKLETARTYMMGEVNKVLANRFMKSP